MHRRDEHDFERWLEAVTERADPFMAWLGAVFALLVGFELTVEVSPGTAWALTAAGWSIWVIFALELAAKLWLAPRRLRFLRRHWPQVVMLLIPTLRVLRFLRLARLGRAFPAARVVSSSYRARGTARQLAGSRLGYLAGVSGLVIVAVAQLAYLFERDAPGSAFAGFGDALLWAAATVLALQADPVPETVGGRLTMLAGFVFGLVVVATLAATFGAYLIESRRERAEEEGA